MGIKFINHSYYKIIKVLAGKSNVTLRYISEESKLDVARISPLMREWKQEKIVTKDDSGQYYRFSITPKGREIYKKLEELIKIFEGNEYSSIKKLEKEDKKEDIVKKGKNKVNVTTNKISEEGI